MNKVTSLNTIQCLMKGQIRVDLRGGHGTPQTSEYKLTHAGVEIVVCIKQGKLWCLEALLMPATSD